MIKFKEYVLWTYSTCCCIVGMLLIPATIFFVLVSLPRAAHAGAYEDGARVQYERDMSNFEDQRYEAGLAANDQRALEEAQQDRENAYREREEQDARSEAYMRGSNDGMMEESYH